MTGYISPMINAQSEASGKVAIIGGGPAGLMAAEAICDAGIPVDIFDAMPSLGRKFLMAGKSGLNLTNAEPMERLLRRYSVLPELLRAAIDAFPPQRIQDWANGLEIETFVGSTNRVFPKEMKAAPLLRAWLRRLRNTGATIHARHRWTGWDDAGALVFDTPEGRTPYLAEQTILALGGGSWRRLGSDGRWTGLLAEKGVEITPFKPSNCGFEVDWSDHLRTRIAGQPVKAVALSFNGQTVRGDLMITEKGVEGGPVYMLSTPLRDALASSMDTVLSVDLKPDLTLSEISERLGSRRGKASLSTHMKRSIGLKGAASVLLHEFSDAKSMASPEKLAALIKALPISLLRPRPIDEAISTAGGVSWSSLNAGLELRSLPGTFACGEMLDWDAPTGGYLLTACLASGHWAGNAVAKAYAK